MPVDGKPGRPDVCVIELVREKRRGEKREREREREGERERERQRVGPCSARM